MSNRTILLIDYDPQSIESAIKPLTSAGYTVEVANDGIAGLQAFERLQPDLVLIEPMVPKKHGFEVCQEIKGSDLGRNTPVLITTGFYRGRKHQVEAKQFYGCDEYLEKPIAEELLVSTCQRYLVDDTDDPQLLEDLEAEAPATARVPDEGLPELEELSEEEIVARLDDLIKEDPGLFADEPAPAGPEPALAPLDGDRVVAEAESPEPAESALPVAEPVAEPAGAEPSSGTDDPATPAEGPVRLGTRAQMTYGAPGTGAEAPDPLPVPEEDFAAPVERPRSSSRRPWIIAAAAGLLIAAAAGIIVVPRLLNGDSATPVASVSPRPAAEAPLPAREPVADEPAESPGPLALAAEAIADDAAATSPANTRSGSTAPAGRTERGGEPASRPERTTPEPRADAARQTRTEPSLTAPRPSPAAAPATAAVRDETPVSAVGNRSDAQPAEENAAGDAAGSVETLPAPAPSDRTQPTQPVASEEPASEPPPENAPAQPESITAAAEADVTATEPGSVETDSEAEADPPATTPAPARSEESEPDAGIIATPAKKPRIEPPKVVRGTLVDISQVDAVPQPMAKRPPDYPPLARKLRLEGTINLRLLVDEEGRVREVETTTPNANGVLAKAAERAAREWTYRPATKDDVPVKVWIVERVVFQR